MTEDHRFGFRTRALHAGATPDASTGARAVPIYQTSSFVFDDATDAANLFALQKYGNIYSRIGNPTVAALEERLPSLEGGIGAVATAFGGRPPVCTLAAPVGPGDDFAWPRPASGAPAALHAGGQHDIRHLAHHIETDGHDALVDLMVDQPAGGIDEVAQHVGDRAFRLQWRDQR